MKPLNRKAILGHQPTATSSSARQASEAKPPQRFPRLRRVLTSSLLCLLCLAGSLPVATAATLTPVAQGDASTPNWQVQPQARAAGEGETWFVTWSATGEGFLDGPYGDDGHIIRSRKISMEGSGIARYADGNPGTGWRTEPFAWTVTDDLFEQITEPCYGGGTWLRRERQAITNPQEDPEWVDDFLVPGPIFEREDGSKYMSGFWFVHSTEGMPWFQYQDDHYDVYCNQPPNSTTYIEDYSWYAGIIWWEAYKGGLHIIDLECDDTATSCWWDYAFTSTNYSDMPMRVEWSVRARRLPDSPSIDQEPELLETNVFLPGIALSDRFEGNLDCDKQATCRAVRELDTPTGAPQREPIGPAPSGNYPKTIDIGTLPPGQTLLTAQAEGTTPAPPDTKQILVAAELPKWAANIAGIIAHKVGDYAMYVWEVKFPEPAIKKLYDVPSFVPFIGGKQAGAELPQGALKTEAKSTGEVGLEGATGGAIVVGDSSVGINITGKANGVLDLRGVKDVKGEAEFKVFGKVAAEEPLLKAVPALRPAVAAIEEFSPAVAKWIEERAKAVLEIEPNWSSSFTFSDKTGNIEIDSAVITPGIGIKVKAILKIVEEIAEMAVGIGGEIKAAFPTPPLSLKEVAINFAILVDAVIYHFGVSTQAGYACTFPGTCQAVGTDPNVMAANNQIFYLPARAYLDDADYASWTADAAVQAAAASAAAANEVVDIQLVGNIYPQAHPTLARGGSKLMVLWSHDAAGKPDTAAQELRFTQRTGDTWSTAAAITNDGVADFNRELVFVPNGHAVAVWHRFDSGSPGDMNTDPKAYLSHVQVAASTWNGTTWSAPVQLSTSGSLNERPALAPTTTGAIAVWIGNAGNQMIGDATHPDTVYYATYIDDTATWSAAAPVLSNIEGLLGVRLAARGSKAAMVYSRDMDGDFATDGDRELFYVLWDNSWGAPVRLTNNQVADELPLLVLNEAANPQLVWQQGESLRFLNGSWNAANAQTLPFATPGYGLRLVNDPNATTSTLLALTWEEMTALDTRVGYAVYDGTQNLWSNPQTLEPAATGMVTGTSSMVTHVSPALVGEKLLLAYQVAEVTVTTMDVEGVTVPNVPKTGKHALRYAEIPLSANAAIYPDEITVTPLDAKPGETVTVAAKIHNTGQLPTVPAAVDLVLSVDNSTVTKPLPVIRGGEVVTITFPYVQPAAKAGTLKIEVDPNWQLDEADRKDNEAFVVSPPLFTTLATRNTPLGPQVGAIFTQQGALQGEIAMTATLHLDSPTGPVVGEAHAGFPEEPVMRAVTTTVTLSPTQLGEGAHLIHWVGPHGVYGVTAAHVYADLALEAESVEVGSGQISALVANDGNLPSTGGALVVYDRMPGTAGAQELARLPLPSIAPGKFATVAGGLNLAATAAGAAQQPLVYVQLEAASGSPDLNPANNLYAAGDLVNTAPILTQPSLYLPLLQN